MFRFFLIRILDHINPKKAAQVAANLFATPRRIPRPEHENELIKKAERLILQCGLVTYRFGDGRGPRVLLVHGWEGRGTQLGFFAEPLVQQGFTVFALDGPAHGESPGHQVNPALYATFLKTVVAEIGGVEAVIAHSFGAGCSVLAAANNMKAQKLVLVAGPDRYARVVDLYCKQIRASESLRGHLYDRVTARVGIHPDQMRVSTLASELTQKILIIHDRGDKSVAFESAEHIHQAVRGSELLVTEGLGHRRILKDPKVIERVTKFILSP